jgi:hypothetical protein
MDVSPSAAHMAIINPLAGVGRDERPLPHAPADGGPDRPSGAARGSRRRGAAHPLSTLPDDPFAGRSLVVLNPAAGQDEPARVRRQIGGALAVRGAPFDLVETRGAGDAERFARDAVRLGYRAVLAAGGDGTIAEVITGLAGSDVPLGILPLGTANQVAANLGVPRTSSAPWRWRSMASRPPWTSASSATAATSR